MLVLYMLYNPFNCRAIGNKHYRPSLSNAFKVSALIRVIFLPLVIVTLYKKISNM